MSIRHIVMFRFKADTSPEAVREVCTRLLGLKDACVHPSTAKSYIRSAVGGKDNSVEGLQNGITHVFVVEFASAADRDYYVNEDLAHREFVETFITGPAGVIDKANVVDFTPGAF